MSNSIRETRVLLSLSEEEDEKVTAVRKSVKRDSGIDALPTYTDPIIFKLQSNVLENIGCILVIGDTLKKILNPRYHILHKSI